MLDNGQGLASAGYDQLLFSSDNIAELCVECATGIVQPAFGEHDRDDDGLQRLHLEHPYLGTPLSCAVYIHGLCCHPRVFHQVPRDLLAL
jgi:hypothetical protein